MEVRVAPRADGSWAVHVEHGGARTDHRVTVPPGFAATVGCRAVGDAELVRASFAFLLDREPAGSILDRFALDVIPRYFPEYATAIRGYLDGPKTDYSTMT
jgi:hypothetical protein